MISFPRPEIFFYGWLNRACTFIFKAWLLPFIWLVYIKDMMLFMLLWSWGRKLVDISPDYLVQFLTFFFFSVSLMLLWVNVLQCEFFTHSLLIKHHAILPPLWEIWHAIVGECCYCRNKLKCLLIFLRKFITHGQYFLLVYTLCPLMLSHVSQGCNLGNYFSHSCEQGFN